MPYYIKRHEKVNGPFTDGQIKSGVKTGKLKKANLIGKSENGPWKSIGQALESSCPAERGVPIPNEPDQVHELEVSEYDELQPLPDDGFAFPEEPTIAPSYLQPAQTRACPFCAEQILAPAIKLTVALGRSLEIQSENESLMAVIERACCLHSEIDTIPPPNETVSDSADLSETQISRLLIEPEATDEIGRLGGYRILRLLATGGMGVVFLAEDLKLQRQVALKIIKPVVNSNPSARKRFLREARAAAAIEHDNIVHVYQVGEDQETPFIAMQLLRGELLLDRLERLGKFEQHELLRISSEIACGLEAAHQKGLIHRDIKPANIWLEKNTNRVKILDFGLARAVDSNSGETKFGTLLGTPKYMAPEQAVGKDCDERSDLFSLGCVMYHLATGRPPFGGESVTEVLIQVAREDPVDVRKIAPGVDFAIADLIMGLLSKQPSKRPSSAAEVIAKIERIGKSITQTGNHGALRIIAGKLRDIRTSLPLKSKLVLVVTVVIISLVGVYLLPSANSLFGGNKTNGEAEIERKTMSEINPGQSGSYTFNLFDDFEPLVSSVHGHRDLLPKT